MTISASNLALLYLFFDALQRLRVASTNVEGLLFFVVELQNAEVGVSTIDARMFHQVESDIITNFLVASLVKGFLNALVFVRHNLGERRGGRTLAAGFTVQRATTTLSTPK